MTIDVGALLSYWEQRIQRDLTPFVDPGTTLTITRDKRTIGAVWKQRGEPREAAFAVSMESGAQVQYRGQSLGYKSFFASPDMANLLSIAKMILQSSGPQIFVETRGRRVAEDNAPPDLALTVLRAALSDAWGGEDATLVIMVTAEAGAGKTSVLQELVRRQAEDYARGKTDCLFLYVNAQGRALARFNEALATELQDLRAVLTYHGVSTLVRLGILVPVIDGFDELLGVGGYDDAFSSLANFVEDLDGAGRLIASARSTYYEQEFVARANRVSSLGAQIWKQIPIEVLAWADNEFKSYILQRARIANLGDDEAQRLVARVEVVFRGQNRPLRTKPLFVARTVELVLAGWDLAGDRDLLDEMVAAYLERERSDKLLDRSGGALLSVDQIKSLLTDLAEEMWNQETRELDRRSVREVAEYVLVTQGLEESVQRVVIERMPSLAFLIPSGRPGGIAFEHETFFAYFLAHRFARALASPDSVPGVLLGRSVLPLDVANITVRVLGEVYPDVRLEQALGLLGGAGGEQTPRRAQVRENAGLLVQVLLRDRCGGECAELTLRNLVFPGGDLKGVCLRRAVLEEVEFRRVDLRETRLLASVARGVMLVEALVDRATTRLELAGLDPGREVIGLRTTGDGAVRSVFDPDEMQELLVAIGAVAAVERTDNAFRSIDKQVLSLLQRFVRVYNRSNPVCTSDDNMATVFRDARWREIERLLLETRVVTEESRRTGGPAKKFLRRQVLAEEIMAGVRKDARVPEPVRRFWHLLEEKFPGSPRVG